MASAEASPIRKRRRWAYIAIAAGLLIVLIILLIPTIASLGPARSYVLAKINAKLHGKLQIKSWSLGWHSGFRARGISLEGKGGDVLSIKSVSTDLTLPELIHGNYRLGNVTIEGMRFKIQIGPEGNGNLQETIQPQTQGTQAAVANSSLSNVSATIHLNDVSGTIWRMGSPTVGVVLSGDVKIPNINQPIENNLSVSLQSNASAAGSVAIQGKVTAIQNNKVLNVSKMDIREDVSLIGIDLSVLAPFLPIKQIDTVAGRADGNLNVKKIPSGGVVARGEIRAADVKVSGPALRGDMYSSRSIVARVPEVRVARGGGVDIEQPIEIQFDQGRAVVSARTTVDAMENLLSNKAPGSAGFISAHLNVDCAALSRQLPHTLDLRPGLSLNSAQMTFSTKVNLSNDQTAVSQHLELSHISGSNSGQPIAISPITLDAGTTVLPSNTAVPTLHEISVKLASDFATADFHGVSLGDFSGIGRTDLAVAQHQLQQIFDFHNWRLQGTVTASLSSHGDVTKQSAPLEIVSRIDAENLHITGGVQPIDQRSVIVNCSGKILRDDSDSIMGIDQLQVELQTNQAGRLVRDFVAAGSLRLNPGESGWRELREAVLNVDLPDLPQTASLVQVAKTQGVRWTSGKATARINLHQANGSLSGDAQIAASDLAFVRGQNVYRFDPVRVVMSGRLSETEISVSRLQASLGPLATMELVQRVVLKNSPRPSAQGEMVLHADLARVSALASAWNGALPGRAIFGELVLDQRFSTDGAHIASRGRGAISNLRVVADSLTQFHEQSVKILNDLSYDSTAQSLSFKSCSISMESSRALDAALSGSIRNLYTSRDFDDAKLVLSYDLGAIVTIVTPLLPPADQQQLAQYSIAGVQKHTIAITGSFPAGTEFAKSIRRIRLTGSLGLDRLEGNGVTITHLSPELILSNGIVTITGNGATPAELNGGTLNLAGISYDLTDPAQRISVPPDLVLVHGTHLNATMMGKFGTTLSPLLSNPTQAAGVLDVSIKRCTNFSIAQFSHPLFPGTSTGNILANFSVANVQIANNMAVLIGAFSPQTIINHQLVGNINNAEVSIGNGTIYSNLKLRIGQSLMLGFHGNVILQTQELQHFILDFPTPLLGDFTHLVHLNQVPTDIPIPITGTTSHFTLDLSGVNQLLDLAKHGLEKGGKTVEKALDKGVNKAGGFFNKLFNHNDNNDQQ